MLRDITNVNRIHSRLKGYKPEELVYITWNFTTTCNFACRYCPSELHDGGYGFPEYDKALNFFRLLKEQLPKKCFLTIELLGGEPTMWPKLIDFLIAMKKLFMSEDGYYTEQKICIMIDTNASRTNRWFTKLRDAELWDVAIVNSSFHADFCDPDLFFSNLEIVSHTYQTNANLMLDPKHFWTVVDLIKRMKGNIPVDFSTKCLRPDLGSHKLIDGYTEEMLEWIHDESLGITPYQRSKFKVPGATIGWPMEVQGDHERVHWQSVLVKQQHKFLGWKCSAGSRRFYIQPNGDVYPCSRLIDLHVTPTSRSFIEDGTGPNRKYIMGNINNDDIKIYDEYMPCPKTYCSCKIDVVCDKYKINTSV
tara:strand:- start:12909 stop:13997 length:1089 start_codon:yes stop_codon:yes gene_type:complete